MFPSLRFSAAISPPLIGLLLANWAPRQSLADGETCTKVTTQSLAIPSLVISGSKLQEAAGGLPKHCIVTGEVNDRTGADGRHYAIGFEMRLPVEWNGRFLHQANGGNDGVVLPATGDQPRALASGGVPALARGFAVLSSDSGHSARRPGQQAARPRGRRRFGLDPQARRDYGYSADMTLAPIAQAIIAAHYGRKPDYSYMAGCSNGGAIRWSRPSGCRKPTTASSPAIRASICRGRRSSTPGTRRPSSRPIRTSANRSRKTTRRWCRGRSLRLATGSTGSRTGSPPISPLARRLSASTTSSAQMARLRTACQKPKSKR